MAVNRSKIIDENFIKAIQSLPESSTHYAANTTLHSETDLSMWEAVEIFQSMLSSRHLDIYSRELKKDGNSFYTIGSSGHELNATIGAVSRISDPAYLH